MIVTLHIIEPAYFKTSPGENATVSHKEIFEYDKFRRMADAYTSNGILNAPESDAVVNTLLKIVKEKYPKSVIRLVRKRHLF